MSVSKRLRYEILRRDNYACRYCGAKAPDVELTVDHVIPVSLGGTDEPSNLRPACGPCNGGKTSSSPDAPLVADVAEDALRWSRAIATAAERMRAEVAGRQDIYDQFERWWGRWTYGYKKLPIPRPDDWRGSVDSFLSAGLPLEVLEWCVTKAMGSKAAPDGTWRYMCGIAWAKVRDLQEAAGRIAGGVPEGAASEPAPDLYDLGRLELARELLDELSDEERDHFIAQADINDYLAEIGEPPQTETQTLCQAASDALSSIGYNLDYLSRRLENTLKDLPGGVGERALAVPHDDRLSRLCSPRSNQTFRLIDVLYALDDFMQLPSARSYMNALPDEERAEWLEFATNLCSGLGDPDRLLVRAAECAQAVKDDGIRYDAMCAGAGASIPVCPKQVEYCVRVAELDCCGPGGPEGHKGHLMCSSHLELLINGKYVSKRGRTLSALDFTDAKVEEAPF